MPAAADAERIAWLRLARTDGVGPVTFHQPVLRFETAQAALSALPDLARRSGRAAPMRIKVLAVSGSPLDPRARGTNDLIRQGGALCEGAEDVLRGLETFGGFRAPDAPPYRGPPTCLADGEGAALRDRVAALLSPTPVSRDELVRAAAAPARPSSPPWSNSASPAAPSSSRAERWR